MTSTAESPRMGRARRALLAFALAALAPACSGGDGPPDQPPKEVPSTAASSTLALTSDDSALWVVNPDADSVSVLDPKARTILAEIPLGAGAPKVDPATKRYEPAVLPRALAIVGDRKVYVAGEAADKVFVIDAESRKVLTSIAVPAAPVAVAAAPDGSAVYVVSHEAARVTKIDPRTDMAVGDVALTEHPWGASVSGDGKLLYVTHILLDPGVTVVDTASFTVRSKVPLADQPRPTPFDKRIPNGLARGAHSIIARPGTGELWVPHLLLAVKTPQPDLDFESTVFPTISTFSSDGSAEGRRLLFKPSVAGAEGAFSDSVSGPRAVTFTPDGKLALLALGQSEDVMVFDAEAGQEVGLVRPVPSTMLEGIIVDHAGKHAYVDGRNTHNVTVLAIDPSSALAKASIDGAPIERLASDPMPADLRRGQRLFYSANSAAFPMTKNFWVACSSCHIEGGSDAVTWLFKQGPRDTPSNAGGPINTGFLMRQGFRSSVHQYDETINIEQGGNYNRNAPAQQPDLEALANFVNYAVPLPRNPYLAPGGELTDAQKRGKVTFDAACSSCHSGAFYTDSGSGNPDLDFEKPVVLHDIGTCVTKGSFPDKPSQDVAGNTHTACDFDTPTLRGIFATPPYFHDGSAATLGDVLDRLPSAAKLTAEEKADLIAYLQTL